MFPRAALVILAVLVAIIGTILFTGWPFQFWRAQMAAGSAYMKSLTEADVGVWIARTERFLSEYDPSIHPIGVYGLGAKPIPSDLQKLKIVRIDIARDQVRYVWMGGMDHTELEVDRLSDGSFKFVAHYNDAKSEVIWPKASTTLKSNQAMQPTAGRSDASLHFMKTRPLQSTLALASGG